MNFTKHFKGENWKKENTKNDKIAPLADCFM